MSEKLLVPDIGDFENVEVIELLVKEGQVITKNDPVVTIESDKSSVEIPSTLSGKIDSIKVKVGDKVSKGDLILSILSLDNKTSPSKAIPKDTENLIKEAEKSLEKKHDQITQTDNNERKPACIAPVKNELTKPKGEILYSSLRLNVLIFLNFGAGLLVKSIGTSETDIKIETKINGP